MQVKPIHTRIFKEGENLESFVVEHVPAISDATILVVTSKIVALSEKRTADVARRDEIIKQESDVAIRTKYTWLTIKDGTVMSSAGVDESNADGKLVLLPKDSFAAAEALRSALVRRFGLTKFGVVITDSRVLPLRAGIVGVALGYAGIKGVRDYRGTPDIFGRILKLARTDVADSLATAAVLEMGEGAEQRPLCIIEDAPVEFVDTIDRTELHIDIEDDLYRPLFDTLN
ncbi:MAG TPA: coenzyme F420-0:L-glutamate ligase [Candidatus Paceibacterota bacterium]|nr:coenzyme F420-0:L-glutamate ligase [Candidatus Paceibacterota bacterium]